MGEAYLGRRGWAEGAVLHVHGERAMAVKEAPRPVVAVSQDPEEHSHLDGSKVAPVVVRSGDSAAGELGHLVDGHGAEGALRTSEQVPSVRRVTEAVRRRPAIVVANSGTISPKR